MAARPEVEELTGVHLTFEQTPGADLERSDYATFLTFHDPDGNSWLVQEVGHAVAGA